MREFQRYRKIVVCAQQAGAGALLARILGDNAEVFDSTIYAHSHAAPFFEKLGLRCRRIDKGGRLQAASILETDAPEAVLLGASVGYSLEKALMLEAIAQRIPVFSFVDHYWNLWQRFAHERTAARWQYLPTRIYVIDGKSRQRILKLGCPPRLVRVYPHPVLRSMRNDPALMSPEEARRSLKIPAHLKIVLFISEWEYRVSKKWKFDQPRRADVVYLLMSLLRAAARSNTVVVIKTHPAERSVWERHLRAIDRSLFRVVTQFDKPSLLDLSDAVFGLNSMLMLEALARGRRVYSLHKHKSNRDTWLSTWNRRIKELGSATDCERTLQAIRPNSGG